MPVTDSLVPRPIPGFLMLHAALKRSGTRIVTEYLVQSVFINTLVALSCLVRGKLLQTVKTSTK